MTGTRERLSEALTTRTTIGVVFDGGSQPGRWRQIVPTSIKGDVVRANCLATGGVRSFTISKLVIVDLAPALVPAAIKYRPAAEPAREVAA